MDYTKFTEKQFADAAKFLLQMTLTQPVSPTEKPVAILLGGQPGGGKSGLHELYRQALVRNVVVINGDNYRAFHPYSRELDKEFGKASVDQKGPFSNRMVEFMIDRLSSAKYNVIIEGTLRSAEVPIKTGRLLKERGYSVTLAAMAVKPEISYLSTIYRAEEMIASHKAPRYTAKSSHDEVVHKIAGNLNTAFESRVFDDIRIFDRANKCLYSSIETPEKSPQSVMHEALFGEWSDIEKTMLERTVEGIKAKMADRGASSDEKEEFSKALNQLGQDPDKEMLNRGMTGLLEKVEQLRNSEALLSDNPSKAEKSKDNER